MDQFKITIEYQTPEAERVYGRETLAETTVRVVPISDEDKARLAARIVSEAHKTIVAQQSDGSMALRDTILRTLERARVDEEAKSQGKADPEHDPDTAAGPREGDPFPDKVFIGGDPLPGATSDEPVGPDSAEDEKLPVEA